MSEQTFQIIMVIGGVLLTIIGFFIVQKLNDFKEKDKAQDDRMTVHGTKLDGIDQRLTKVEVQLSANATNDANTLSLFEKLLDAKLTPMQKDIDYIKTHLK